MLRQFNVYRNPSSQTNKVLPYYMIVQDVGKEARESGVQGAILGNGKRLVRRVEQNAPQATTQRPTAKPAQAPSDDDSIPF